MAVDISIAKTGQSIKNGTLLTMASVTGEYSKSDLYVVNTPASGTIASKYDARFDDPTYYSN